MSKKDIKSEYYDKIMDASDLNEKEKVLLLKIKELSNDEGYCQHTNYEFAEIFDVNYNTMSSRINALKRKGYLEIEVQRKDVPVATRRLYPIK